MRKTAGCALILLLAAAALAGCSGGGGFPQLIFTAGLSADGLFRIEDEEMTEPQAKIVLMTELSRYQTLYGEGILSRDMGGRTLEEEVREGVLEALGKVMVMDEMADIYQIRLTEEERGRILSAAAQYYGELGEAQLAYTEASQEDVAVLMERIALADKVFRELTAEEDIEISDDEARVITVKHIMKKTGGLGPEEKEEAYSQMLAVFDRLTRGEDFDTLAGEFSEDTRIQYSFGRGEMDEAFEEAAFALDAGEMSTVVESAQGYHIILCVSNFDREATDVHKEELEKQKRWQAFQEVYEEAARELVCQTSERRMEGLAFPLEAAFGGADFYEAYESCLAQEN